MTIRDASYIRVSGSHLFNTSQWFFDDSKYKTVQQANFSGNRTATVLSIQSLREKRHCVCRAAHIIAKIFLSLLLIPLAVLCLAHRHYAKYALVTQAPQKPSSEAPLGNSGNDLTKLEGQEPEPHSLDKRLSISPETSKAEPPKVSSPSLVPSNVASIAATASTILTQGPMEREEVVEEYVDTEFSTFQTTHGLSIVPENETQTRLLKYVRQNDWEALVEYESSLSSKMTAHSDHIFTLKRPSGLTFKIGLLHLIILNLPEVSQITPAEQEKFFQLLTSLKRFTCKNRLKLLGSYTPIKEEFLKIHSSGLKKFFHLISLAPFEKMDVISLSTTIHELTIGAWEWDNRDYMEKIGYSRKELNTLFMSSINSCNGLATHMMRVYFHHRDCDWFLTLLQTSFQRPDKKLFLLQIAALAECLPKVKDSYEDGLKDIYQYIFTHMNETQEHPNAPDFLWAFIDLMDYGSERGIEKQLLLDHAVPLINGLIKKQTKFEASKTEDLMVRYYPGLASYLWKVSRTIDDQEFRVARNGFLIAIFDKFNSDPDLHCLVSKFTGYVHKNLAGFEGYMQGELRRILQDESDARNKIAQIAMSDGVALRKAQEALDKILLEKEFFPKTLIDTLEQDVDRHPIASALRSGNEQIAFHAIKDTFFEMNQEGMVDPLLQIIAEYVGVSQNLQLALGPLPSVTALTEAIPAAADYFDNEIQYIGY